MNERSIQRTIGFIKTKIERALDSSINSNDFNENAVIDQTKSLLKDLLPEYNVIYSDSEKKEREIQNDFTLNVI